MIAGLVPVQSYLVSSLVAVIRCLLQHLSVAVSRGQPRSTAAGRCLSGTGWRDWLQRPAAGLAATTGWRDRLAEPAPAVILGVTGPACPAPSSFAVRHGPEVT